MGDIAYKRRFHHFGPWPLSQDEEVQFTTKNYFHVYLYSISFFRTKNGVEISIFTSKRSIRSEVDTYRLNVFLGSLHTQQLHGFDELRNVKESFVTPVRKSILLSYHFICPYHILAFSFFGWPKKIERMENGKIAFLAFRMEVKIT
jgi:hypothetical protein